MQRQSSPHRIELMLEFPGHDLPLVATLRCRTDTIDGESGGDDGNMSTVLETPMDAETDDRLSIEERYQQLSEQWPGHKVEIVDDRIVVREVPTTDHADLIFRLLLQLMPLVTERGWKIWNDVALFLGPQLGRYRPDILVVPPDPGLWGEDHVWGKDTLLVVEVVSRSSAHDDHEVKPRGCALGKV